MVDGLTRPIIGIENRTPSEVFDIMCDRITRALTPADDATVERVAAAMRPNLFRFYPGGQSQAHEEARQMARAAIAALQTPVASEGE